MSTPHLTPKFVAPGVGKVLTAPGGDTSVPKITADETGDRFSAAEYTVMPQTGPPLHLHEREDEAFWILEGEVTFSVDGTKITAPTGSFVYGPRDVPHTFKNLTAKPARMLLIVTPARNFEQFYDKIGGPRPDGSVPSEPEVIDRIMKHAPEHGIRVLGPSPL